MNILRSIQELLKDKKAVDPIKHPNRYDWPIVWLYFQEHPERLDEYK